MKKFSQEYIDYINSDEWAKIRNKVLIRDNFKCSLCGNMRNLQVHHLNYNHFMNEENHLEDLMTLCNECHEKIEKQKEKQDNTNNNYLQEKQENINRYQLEKEERERLYYKNFKTFIDDWAYLDYADICHGCYDFCDLRFLKKFIINEYGENFYDNLRKTDIQKYLGNKRNIAIIELISEGKSNNEILKYHFTNKRIISIRQLIEKMRSYNDIYSLMIQEYDKIIYGGILNREIIECLINCDFIKDNKFSKKTLLKNMDMLIQYVNFYYLTGEDTIKPELKED